MSPKTYYPIIDTHSITAILERIAIFGGLDESQLNELFQTLQLVSYAKGEIIFEKGDEPCHIYVVKSGKVEIALEGSKFAVKRLVFDIGQCFGESSVIGIQSHTGTASAVEDCELIVLSKTTLMNYFEDDKTLFGQLILNIARETSRRLHRADEIILHYYLSE